MAVHLKKDLKFVSSYGCVVASASWRVVEERVSEIGRKL